MRIFGILPLLSLALVLILVLDESEAEPQVINCTTSTYPKAVINGKDHYNCALVSSCHYHVREASAVATLEEEEEDASAGLADLHQR